MNVGTKIEHGGAHIEYDSLMNLDEGWVSRKVFYDRDIYEEEMRQIFARVWLFVAHESQIPNPGDFVTTYMGEDGVIVARQRDKSVGVFINSCPHRGNKVCHADGGNARRFVCNYHGWAFDIGGNLMGMNAEEVYDPGDIDKSEWGMQPVAKVGVYKGLIFATFDPGAPSLEDYLGDYRWYLDCILDSDEGGSELVGGTMKFMIPMNWKVAAENFVGDAYHAAWTHDSASKAMTGGMAFPPIDFENTFHSSANGHGLEFGLDGIGDIALLGRPKVTEYFMDVLKPRMEKRLGALRSQIFGSIASASVFPNLSYLPGISTFRTWLPKGPTMTEVRSWTIVNRDMPDDIKDEITKAVMQTFGPSGTFEMDDGENWEHSTITNKGYVTRQGRLHYGCGISRKDDHAELPGIVHRGQFADSNQREFHRRWHDLMTAESWDDVPDRRSNRLKGRETRDLPQGLKSL
ncbi:aromatic ring-hydroxylating dioxygenase subunit alpha [Sphingopyxis granuli]|nr:aromatic ring-hydroxylating dioxygenase subunit alpha [Sphingopyxis granuli]AMG75145.1 Ring hydroxylating dioxygenase alpha subunit [Sphingopyxis granuli]